MSPVPICGACMQCCNSSRAIFENFSHACLHSVAPDSNSDPFPLDESGCISCITMSSLRFDAQSDSFPSRMETMRSYTFGGNSGVTGDARASLITSNAFLSVLSGLSCSCIPKTLQDTCVARSSESLAGQRLGFHPELQSVGVFSDGRISLADSRYRAQMVKRSPSGLLQSVSPTIFLLSSLQRRSSGK